MSDDESSPATGGQLTPCAANDDTTQRDSNKAWRPNLPDWFLKHKIKIYNASIPPAIPVYFEGERFTTDLPSVSDAEKLSDGDAEAAKRILLEKADCKSSIPWEQYLELYDTVISGITIGAVGYPLRSQSGIIIKNEKLRNIDAIDSTLMRVAHEAGADLISFDLGDLQDIAWHFHLEAIERQKSGLPRLEPANEGKASYSPPSLADVSVAEFVFGYQFGDLSSSGDSKPIWKGEGPAPTPTTAILDGALKVKSNACAELVGARQESAEVARSSRPVIIHIKNGGEFMHTDKGRDCIRNFGAAVRDHRECGKKVLLLVSTFVDQIPEKKEENSGIFAQLFGPPEVLTPEEDLRQELQIRKEAIIPINTTELGVNEDQDHQKRTLYARNIRRTLRHNLPKDLLIGANDLLAPYPEEDFAHSPDIITVLGRATLSDENAQRAARQLCGRIVQNKMLNTADIKAVLEAVHELHGEKDSTASEKFKKKLKDMEADCNEQEKSLLSCVVDTTELETTFNDVIIDNEIKEMIKQLISLSNLSSTQSHRLLRQVQMKGALFYGPPGTGKTYLTQAIARESNAHMLSVNAGQIMTKWVGDTEKNILALFSLCKKLHPCILFIDEGDALFYRRKSCDQAWRRNHITLFLQQMDGLQTDKKTPFVIVATNRPSDLDEAFLRRLPYKAMFPLPTENERRKILRLFLQDEDVDDPIIIEQLARKTEGYSGADLKNLCGQAALSWAVERNVAGGSTEGDGKESKLLLTALHFTKALRRARPAAARESRKINEDFLQDASGRSRPGK